jgi:UDP-N-acetyl-D-mannosaminuronic acid dehydrogenase
MELTKTFGDMMEFKKLCVLGLGYIGLPTASTFAMHGLEVVGVDVNQDVVAQLNSGKLHIHEPGLDKIVEQVMASGHLTVSTEPTPADAFIIAVPTPFYGEKKADLSYVRSAAEAVVPHLKKGNLVVLESTSPPLTTCNEVAPILEKSGLKAGEDFLLAYSPERVLPGQILRELIENARVIGGVDQESAEAGRDLYRTFVRGEIILTNATTAEMVKLMENTYRDINIAIANEFSHLADRFGIDVWEAIKIANLHPRVNILNPGPGVGGHCISVDPWFLVEAAPDITPLILTARQLNDAQPEFVMDLVKRQCDDDLSGKRIAALGLAFKPNVDDLRESPAVDIARLLTRAGADVRAHDPFKPQAKMAGLNVVETVDEAIADAEMILLLVKHDSLAGLEPGDVARRSSARKVIDTVNAWNREAWMAAGFDILTLGVGK